MSDGLANRDCSTADAARHEHHRPEHTLLYQLVERHYPAFLTELTSHAHTLPKYVCQEFEDYLKCGHLEHGFLRSRCEACHAEKLVAFSCKRRGFCPSCGAKRMVESTALLADEVLPHLPMRQWVLSVPTPLRFLFAREPKVMGKVLGIVYRTLSGHLIRYSIVRARRSRAGRIFSALRKSAQPYRVEDDVLTAVHLPKHQST
jgi:hypothetical protein